jgi:ribosomal protein S18 acetylase RimI-like enzyme
MQPQPAPARPEELPDAFRLIFQDLPPGERTERVAHAVNHLREGRLDPEGVLVERGPAGLLGAIVCMPVAGAGALIWPPRSVGDGHELDREDRLVRRAVHWLRGRGAKLAQALLSPAEAPLAAPLRRNGFSHVTHLWYLCRDLGPLAALPDAPAALAFRPFDPRRPGVFRQTLLRTYEGTLDCPEVNGVRTIDEVIAGHQAQGRFDPDRWWLALRAGDPVGVLLVVELPESGDWEVAYMGLVPEARRQGLGRQLLAKALHEACAAGVPRVTLSVDGRNLPAARLYQRLGFEPFDRREVYLSVWTP